jgi:hypothetical protein
MKNNVLLLILTAILSGCTTLPVNYAENPEQNLIVGRSCKGVKTLIRSIDDGEILYDKKNKLGDEVWVTPGHHSISVACIKKTRQEPIVEFTTIELNIMTNFYYELRTEFIEGKPNVQVKDYDLSHLKRSYLRGHPSDRIPHLRGF